MRKFTGPILLALAVLLLSPTEGWSLPPCPGSPTKDYSLSNSWTNCAGTFTFANGYKYVGEWRNGQEHGQGTHTWANGDKYVGEFRNGKYHGQGTHYSLADNKFKGDKYVGEWKDGKRHGQGAYFHADGTVTEGIFKNNAFQYAKKAPSPRRAQRRAGSLPPCPGSYSSRTWTNCVGTRIYSVDGTKYVGEFKDGLEHGQGTYTWPNGKKYVGEFKDGIYHGQGTLTYANGRVQEGIWKWGRFQYAKKAPSPRRAQNRLAEKRRRKKEERLARLERELKRKEARLRKREKAFEKKKRQSRTARRTSPATQDDWRSSASGFYLKSTTHIMTNFHVIDNAKVIQVSFPKGGRYRGRVVAKDERNDLAVIKLLKMKPRRSGFGFRFGARVRVGEEIHALGYPLGASLSRNPSMVSGRISSTSGMEDNLSQFRTDAPINKGNSGGPIVNDKGELVGVALAGLVQRGVEGVRFGIKATAASLVLEQVPAMEKFDVQVRARKRKRSPSQIFRELSPYVVMIEVR